MPENGIHRITRAMKWLIIGTDAQRRRVRHEMARISAGVFGDFPLSEDRKVWREDAAFLRDYTRLMPGNPYSQDRKWTLREYVRISNDLTGDMAECGCYEGASAFFMAQASTGGSLHLFDSFEGISAPQARDRPKHTDVMQWNAGDLGASEEKLRSNLADFANVAVHRGWIPERFHEVAECRFKLVHIDVDLYQPTRDSIEFFYPRLAPGGMIVMDDYGFLTCPGAKLAADEFAASRDIRILHLSTGQGIITRPA